MNISLEEVKNILQRRLHKSRYSGRPGFEKSILRLKQQAVTVAEEILPYAEAIIKELPREPIPDAKADRWVRTCYGTFMLAFQKSGQLGFTHYGDTPDLCLAMQVGSQDLNNISVQILGTSGLDITVSGRKTYCKFHAHDGSSVAEQIEKEEWKPEPIWCFEGVTDSINKFLEQMPDFHKRFTAYVESIKDLRGE